MATVFPYEINAKCPLSRGIVHPVRTMSAAEVEKLADPSAVSLSTLAVRRLLDAAKPFTSGGTVTETSGTIPLMDELGRAIEEVEKHMPYEPPRY